ncbi:MAG: HAMP domain-containing histidine kinase [Microscillaceae bacterium]|nr:HAMP domain-containing histidine kinase [Microscillaceae bacterium]
MQVPVPAQDTSLQPPQAPSPALSGLHKRLIQAQKKGLPLPIVQAHQALAQHYLRQQKPQLSLQHLELAQQHWQQYQASFSGKLPQKIYRLRNLALLLGFFVLLAAVLALLFWRISFRRQQHNQILEAAVADKTQALNQVITALERSNQELDTFLYKSSHDLKGPLTTLDGLCNVGLMELENEPAREYLTMQKKVIHNMQLLLFRIMEIGDIRNHEPQWQSFDFYRFCRRMVRSMNRIEGFQKVNFMLEVPEKTRLSTDIDMLDIALDNVIRNAIQHANYKNTQTPTVRISFVAHAQEWLTDVCDNGQGILPEIQDRIFDMFFRGTDYFKGFGLGLYKAKIALEKVGGKVFLVHSRAGETRLRITLPRQEVPLRHNQNRKTQSPTFAVERLSRELN